MSSSSFSKKRTWKRDKSSRPKKVKKTKPGESKKLKCPVWVKSPTNEHPQLTAVLERPFLSTVFFDPVYKCFGYPVPGRDRPHILGGLHKRMKTKFFNGVEMPRREFKKGTKPRRIGSSKGDGSKADKELELAIGAGQFKARDNDGPYSYAVWKHWESIGHVPIAAQLPVVLPGANLCTAGDYFTICTEDGTLHLWELKTGWPVDCKKVRIFEAPLDLVWDLPRNRWQLQVELTRLAYEKVKTFFYKVQITWPLKKNLHL